MSDNQEEDINTEEKNNESDVHSYRRLFPKKSLQRSSLIKPFSLDGFQETIDYKKLTGNIIRRSWIVLVCGLISVLLGYLVLEPMLNLKENYTASTKLLFKEHKRSVSEGFFNITTIKDMIAMKQNCQAAKTSVWALQGLYTSRLTCLSLMRRPVPWTVRPKRL